MTPQPMGRTNHNRRMAGRVTAPRRRRTVAAKGLRWTVPSAVVSRAAEAWNSRLLSMARSSPRHTPGPTRTCPKPIPAATESRPTTKAARRVRRMMASTSVTGKASKSGLAPNIPAPNPSAGGSPATSSQVWLDLSPGDPGPDAGAGHEAHEQQDREGARPAVHHPAQAGSTQGADDVEHAEAGKGHDARRRLAVAHWRSSRSVASRSGGHGGHPGTVNARSAISGLRPPGIPVSDPRNPAPWGAKAAVLGAGNPPRISRSR